MEPTLAHFLPNPEYGKGIYRRRLKFASDSEGSVAQVDDTHHSYWLVLDHDNVRITGVEAGFIRAPNTACPGAPAGLAALIGLPVRETASTILSRLPTTSNCTHLADLACWSLAQLGRCAQWEVSVPDQVTKPVWIDIARDGKIQHQWQIADQEIVAPEPLAGQPLMKGFMAWASKEFQGNALVAATMLQRGLFVARGRKYVIDQGAPVPLSLAKGMTGMCWSYSGDRLERATGTTGYVRDFTNKLEAETAPPHVAARLRGAGS